MSMSAHCDFGLWLNGGKWPDSSRRTAARGTLSRLPITPEKGDRVLLLRLLSGHLTAPEIERQAGGHALIVQIEDDSSVGILENELLRR